MQQSCAMSNRNTGKRGRREQEAGVMSARPARQSTTWARLSSRADSHTGYPTRTDVCATASRSPGGVRLQPPERCPPVPMPPYSEGSLRSAAAPHCRNRRVFAAQLRDYFSTDPAAGQAKDRVVACPAVRVPRSDVCRVWSGLPGLMSKKPFFGRAAAETADRAVPPFPCFKRTDERLLLLLLQVVQDSIHHRRTAGSSSS